MEFEFNINKCEKEMKYFIKQTPIKYEIVVEWKWRELLILKSYDFTITKNIYYTQWIHHGILNVWVIMSSLKLNIEIASIICIDYNKWKHNYEEKYDEKWDLKSIVLYS